VSFTRCGDVARGEPRCRAEARLLLPLLTAWVPSRDSISFTALNGFVVTSPLAGFSWNVPAAWVVL